MEITGLMAPPGTRPGHSARPEPRDVALKFESVLVSQMLNAMQSTVEKSGLLDGGSAEETYNEMLNQALADDLSRRGGLGLAEQIVRRIEELNPSKVQGPQSKVEEKSGNASGIAPSTPYSSGI